MGKDSGVITITPREQSDEELLVIGRIVRASAGLEDCLNLWICKLAKCDEATSAVMLNRSNIATKLSIAEGLAKLTSKDAAELHKTAFDSAINQLLSCRNAVAHGAFAGETDDGAAAFVTNVNFDYKPANLERRADCYSIGNLNVIAMSAERRVSQLDDLLGLRALRKKRQWQHALLQQAGQPKGKQDAKQKRPTRSSRA
jgi:hypothetical protein